MQCWGSYFFEGTDLGRIEADLPLSPPSAETHGEQRWDQGLTWTRGTGVLGAASAWGRFQEDQVDERMGVLPRQKRRDRACLQQQDCLLPQEHHVRKQRGVLRPGASVDLQVGGGGAGLGQRGDFSWADSCQVGDSRRGA